MDQQNARVGGLLFDEVKINEGLLYDRSSGKLVGFVDMETGDDGQGEEPEHLLATNVTQFYFKSLFTSFSFPCAYFFTRCVTSEQNNDMSWGSVYALHEFGFAVMLACADGGSYNRTFFQMNSLGSPWRGFNPFTNEPIFFLSDPPHLIKKLQNQLFNSGTKEHETRLMKRGEKLLVWKHIEEVQATDQAGPLRTTPLTCENTDLDSVRKMKNRLAYDVFDPSVAAHLARRSNEETSATQEYVRQGTALRQTFQSTEPRSQ